MEDQGDEGITVSWIVGGNLWGWGVENPGSGSCPVVVFDISSAEASGSSARGLVTENVFWGSFHSSCVVYIGTGIQSAVFSIDIDFYFISRNDALNILG